MKPPTLARSLVLTSHFVILAKLEVSPELLPLGAQLNLATHSWDPTASLGTIIRLKDGYFLMTFTRNPRSKSRYPTPEIESMVFKLSPPPPTIARWMAGEHHVIPKRGRVPPGVIYFAATTEYNGETHWLLVMENYVLRNRPRFDPAWALVRVLNARGKQIHFSFVLLA